jgi:hypothetical protein
MSSYPNTLRGVDLLNEVIVTLLLRKHGVEFTPHDVIELSLPLPTQLPATEVLREFLAVAAPESQTLTTPSGIKIY